MITGSMANDIWPDGNALGSCLTVASPIAGTNEPCTEVVGIVENHRLNALLEEPLPLYFLNQAHPSFPARPVIIVIGTNGDADSFLGAIRAVAAEASTRVRFANVVPLNDYIEPQLRSWRMGASALTAFGFLALIVAAVGLYSVLACDVALRRRELGIRSALGARVSELVQLVVRQAVSFTAAGLGIGLVAAAAAARFVDPLLFQVSARDPLTYALVVLTLLMAATLAALLPTWRATRVDPREALQAD